MSVTEGSQQGHGGPERATLTGPPPDHIEKIGQLGDLADVEPTSHVVAVENALRADEPRPSLPAEIALASAPETDIGEFRVPSPGPAPG